MMNKYAVPKGLRPRELEAVYAISRAVAQLVDIDAALDQIVALSRPVFIFDNVVIFLDQGGPTLEPSYARVIGRGRSAEADLGWGDDAAAKAFTERNTVVRCEKLPGWKADRLNRRDFLGLPLIAGENVHGALVFGRFGGPAYTPDHIRLAEFIAVHITQLLERRKLVEQEASLEAERRLRRLQEDFIATVSHELRTPLGFIKGYATTLLREDTTWDDEARREFLNIIDEEADRLRALIDDLLDSSRLQAGTLRMQHQPVNLDQLLREVTLRALARYEQLSVQLMIGPQIIIRADPVRIAQVFDNLLSNAVKYAPGSQVFIEARLEGDQYHITVQDSGPGIAAEHLQHLFERFYRGAEANSSVHGTGLGLFICRQIVHAHGGEIMAESMPGQGTIFHIYLPCSLGSTDDKALNQEVIR
ncbi:MAG TPA: ATP-binding protein [Anaerolineales bacterium]|nr:ATP-binding protein [Anaerolineales bacterium]